MGTFKKRSPCACWVKCEQIVSEITMNSPCTHWVIDPSPPLQARANSGTASCPQQVTMLSSPVTHYHAEHYLSLLSEEIASASPTTYINPKSPHTCHSTKYPKPLPVAPEEELLAKMFPRTQLLLPNAWYAAGLLACFCVMAQQMELWALNSLGAKGDVLNCYMLSTLWVLG